MIKQPLLHLPLEPLGSRYTEYLQAIEAKHLGELFDVKPLVPTIGVAADIQSGRVLDSVNRPRYAMAQMEMLLTQGRDLGNVYFSDFYHTGLDALAYSGKSFFAYSYLWAQTFDKYDFTATQHMSWMRPWEIMAFNIYRKVFVACPLLKELICAAMPNLEPQIEVVGLPFDSAHIKSLLDVTLCPADPIDVVYSSRWDTEKNPEVFIEVVRSNPNLKFAVCTGRSELTGTATSAIKTALALEEAGRLRIFRGCTKPQYLAVLSRSTVQFNCALQDWVSFTLLEGLAMGCQPLYPNYRSFPEALHFSESSLYAPFEMADINRKLRALVTSKTGFEYREAVLDYHDKALARIAAIIERD